MAVDPTLCEVIHCHTPASVEFDDPRFGIDPPTILVCMDCQTQLKDKFYPIAWFNLDEGEQINSLKDAEQRLAWIITERNLCSSMECSFRDPGKISLGLRCHLNQLGYQEEAIADFLQKVLYGANA